jgi:hypothetical protein
MRCGEAILALKKRANERVQRRVVSWGIGILSDCGHLARPPMPSAAMGKRAGVDGGAVTIENPDLAEQTVSFPTDREDVSGRLTTDFTDGHG